MPFLHKLGKKSLVSIIPFHMEKLELQHSTQNTLQSQNRGCKQFQRSPWLKQSRKQDPGKRLRGALGQPCPCFRKNLRRVSGPLTLRPLLQARLPPSLRLSRRRAHLIGFAPTSALPTLDTHGVSLKRDPFPGRTEKNQTFPRKSRSQLPRDPSGCACAEPGSRTRQKDQRADADRSQGSLAVFAFECLAGDGHGGFIPATQESALKNLWGCPRPGAAAGAGPGSRAVVPAAKSEAFLQQQQQQQREH